jgi:hypothetical protein
MEINYLNAPDVSGAVNYAPLSFMGGALYHDGFNLHEYSFYHSSCFY